jgi:hypothetical protein
MVASSIRLRSAPVARMSSVIARKPSRACVDNSISTYQRCWLASGSRHIGACLTANSSAMRGINSKPVTLPPARS